MSLEAFTEMLRGFLPQGVHRGLNPFRLRMAGFPFTNAYSPAYASARGWLGLSAAPYGLNSAEQIAGSKNQIAH